MTPTQEALSAVAGRERPGTETAVPDVPAWSAAGGHGGLDAAIAAIEAERGPDGWGLLETGATIAALAGAALAGVAATAALADGRAPAAVAWAAVVMAGASWLAVQWKKAGREGSKYVRLAELRGVEASRRSMSSSLATIDRDGIAVHSTLGGGIVTRRVPPELARSCGTTAVGPGHVTLDIRTVDGSRVEIPWIATDSRAIAAFAAFGASVPAATGA